MKIKTRPNPSLYPEMSPEMQLLITEAYTLFLRPVGRFLTDVCTNCCVSEENEQLLVSTPVNQLSEDLIYEYLDAAYTDQRTNEIAHFLPRVLELLAMHKNIRHSTENILDKCHFELPHWSAPQLEFMQRFSKQFMTDILVHSPYQTRLASAMTYILMFNISGISVTHLLSLWQEMMLHHCPTALEHFESLLYYGGNYGDYSDVFSVNPDFNNEVMEWINDRQLAENLLPLVEKYYFENTQLSEEMRYRWDLFYIFLDGNKK
ncbi:hypothetical protein [Capnocytophaga sp.]|uniref:hypothetical protein n=1 Tax=Capnocytophaga sp. TaxID=44737 RepID=UPI0026DCBC40|nr:hypothetical protein [Capnocytophaga sp.]MDO5105518.1 hypothetical protein [Capnocytophaga sp.]